MNAVDPALAARLRRLSVQCGQHLLTALPGRHRGLTPGVGGHFVEHRPYQIGDDLRHMDWRASARADRHLLKLSQPERQLRALLLLDASRSMDYGAGSAHKYEDAAAVLLTLAYVLLAQGDVVQAGTFADNLALESAPVTLLKGHSAVVQALAKPPQGRQTDLAAVLNAVCARWPRRGLVVVASDLLTDDPAQSPAWERLRGRGHAVWVVHTLHQDEIDWPFRDAVQVCDPESGFRLLGEGKDFTASYAAAVQAFVQQQQQACTQAAVLYHRRISGTPLLPSLTTLLSTAPNGSLRARTWS
ncbi:MAG: DUF58 domain-containing protein [Polyangiales bacterium]